jgi:hypothetical protein
MPLRRASSVTRSQRPPRSELKEARLHVARWIGSES